MLSLHENMECENINTRKQLSSQSDNHLVYRFVTSSRLCFRFYYTSLYNVNKHKMTHLGHRTNLSINLGVGTSYAMITEGMVIY